jgi:ArsR family transcriptional regulator
MADIFSVIADPTRRHLLELLLERYVANAPDDAAHQEGEASVSELVHALDLSQPTVSKHLKVLRDAGLVAVREEGQHRYYKLDSSPLETIEDWVIPFLSADFDDAEDGDSAWNDVVMDAAGSVSSFGKNVGRTVAATSHGARSVVEDLQTNATKLVSKLRK